MHMADALLSPAVGAGMCAVSAGMLWRSSARLRRQDDDRKVPLMGVLGAFVFAAQMVNFAIPGTGSSGHLGGGLLLAVLLGSDAAFVTIASVLVVQALFFADGGLLALGCNIFNLGFFPAFVAYPFVYRPLARRWPTLAAVAAGAAGLLAGAAGVVAETAASGISGLPFATFLLLMLPIHLAIGLVEGTVTAATVGLVRRARPDLAAVGEPAPRRPFRKLAAAFLAAALVTAGLLSQFASARPDGLEWTVARMIGETEPKGEGSGLHRLLARLRTATAPLPGYSFRQPDRQALPPTEARVGTTVSGVTGVTVTLAVVLGASFLLRRKVRA